MFSPKIIVFLFCWGTSLSKSTTDTWLKRGVYMLPWHAIPFLKALGMLTPNPCQNGWPRLWRSCNWQKNTQLNHSMAPKEPYRHSKWADVSPLLKYISGAVAPRLKAPKGPYQASCNNALKPSATFKNKCCNNWGWTVHSILGKEKMTSYKIK